jgi:polysaccharide export outer membrane protein
MLRLLSSCAIAALLSACGTTNAWMPSSGANRTQVGELASAAQDQPRIQVLNIDQRLAARLAAAQTRVAMPGALSDDAAGQAVAATPTLTIGLGDFVEVSLWEAPPAVLFGAASTSDARGTSTGRAGALPEQMVDADGRITVPFIGRVAAAGRSTAELEADIVRGLAGKAHLPQAIVRVTRATSSNVTVMGDVTTSLRMPLTARGERLLDALTSAGGTRQPVSKVSVQLTRGAQVHMLALDTLLREPRQNVRLQPGDIVTVLTQPLSFTVLGATGRNEELPFEAQGLTLAQALARAGGLNDQRADARGVFVFRMEDPGLLAGSAAAAGAGTARVPVVYVLDLRDPASFFAAQTFPMAHRDVIYVSNAPGAELQKFLNLLWGAALPAINLLNLSR